MNFCYGIFLACGLLLSTQKLLAQTADALLFDETELSDVREGYVTLSWNVKPQASEYQLISSDGQTVYRGALPQAFVSGLADGSHTYDVVALDAKGEVIARSSVSAVVQVQHWSLGLAGLLFACGLVVFVAIVALIVLGTLRSQAPSIVRTEGAAP